MASTAPAHREASPPSPASADPDSSETAAQLEAAATHAPAVQYASEPDLGKSDTPLSYDGPASPHEQSVTYAPSDHSDQSVYSAPEVPFIFPQNPTSLDSSQPVDTDHSPSSTAGSLTDAQPESNESNENNESNKSIKSSMFFFTNTSSQPKVPRINTGNGPATLKKIRGRPRDSLSQLQQGAEPEPLKQHVSSMPLPPRKSSIHSLSLSRHDHSIHGRIPSVPHLLHHHHPQLQETQHQRDASLGSEASPTVTVGPSIHSHSAHSSEEAASLSLSPASAAGSRHSRRKSWLPGLGGSRLRSKSREPAASQPAQAWVLSPDAQADYNVDYLINCEKVPELWDDNGDLYVFLSPPHSGYGASFKVRMSIIEQSRVLSGLAQIQTSSPIVTRSGARSYGGPDSPTVTIDDTDADRANSPPLSPSPPLLSGTESRLYLPVGVGQDNKPELDRLVGLRNLFALLTGQPLVATHHFPTVFDVLVQVAELLNEFAFGFDSGSNNSYGDAVDMSIGFYVEQNGLADVRTSGEKTLQALVLSEKLRFWPLYNEAFCHAVGKYAALRHLKAPALWDKISHNTLQRLERANLDLVNRQESVNGRLETFEFPSLFAGVANSTSNIEYRHVRFKNWRTSFSDMRAFVLKYYKAQFGSWPPRASSRRNTFTESGLNRQVLRTMYADLCSVYDLLVNRRSVTPRAGEDGAALPMAGSSANAATPLPVAEASVMALRQMLAEFDQSSPPVLPPIPYDSPKLPTLASLNASYPEMSPKDQARFQRSIQPPDLQAIIKASHNPDGERPYESPFLAAFETFELREAKSHKSEHELCEMRIGHWLFLYVVLQSVPMLVIDAPGLQFTEGVEYFLCEPPQGRPPWVEDAGEVRKAWFQTAGGAGPLVELSADVLLYSVEATYHRSHCWLAAKKWEAEKAAGVDAAEGDIPYAAQSVTSVASVPSIVSAGVGSADGSGSGTAVTQADLPMGKRSSGVQEGSGGSASALGLASPVSSSSNPSLATLGTVVSATDSGVTATGSNTSSPRILPTLRNDLAYTGDYEIGRPATSSSALGMGPRRVSETQYSSQLSLPVPALSLPQPMPACRDNYRQLQERATLRHASIGWALEPVAVDSDPSQLDDFQKPVPTPFAGARRIASAGDLRAVPAIASTPPPPARRQNSGNTSPGSLTVPGVTFNSESTFDSILNSIDADSHKKVKKRSSFLPFM